jgi:hypothetical protein
MPGMLINPTRVAATSCHALSPGLSQSGYGVMSGYLPSQTRDYSRGKGAPEVLRPRNRVFRKH